MFWFFALISAFAYALQGALMVHYIRKMDSFSVAMYRTLSLAISMLPLLFFSTTPDILEIKQHLGILSLSSLIVGIGAAMSFTMMNYLPVGISIAISSGTRIIIMLGLGYLFFNENITLPILFLILLILLGNIFLGKSSAKENKKNNLKNFNLISGGLYALIQSSLVAIGFIIMSDIARKTDPLVVAYFWETLIGITLVLVGLLRWLFFRIPLEKITLKQFLNILWICSPTLIGTGGFVLAVNLGPVGIVGAISASSIVFTTILAHMLYKEKISKNEIMAIFLIIIGIIGIKLLG